MSANQKQVGTSKAPASTYKASSALPGPASLSYSAVCVPVLPHLKPDKLGYEVVTVKLLHANPCRRYDGSRQQS